MVDNSLKSVDNFQKSVDNFAVSVDNFLGVFSKARLDRCFQSFLFQMYDWIDSLDVWPKSYQHIFKSYQHFFESYQHFLVSYQPLLVSYQPPLLLIIDFLCSIMCCIVLVLALGH